MRSLSLSFFLRMSLLSCSFRSNLMARNAFCELVLFPLRRATVGLAATGLKSSSTTLRRQACLIAVQFVGRFVCFFDLPRSLHPPFGPVICFLAEYPFTLLRFLSIASRVCECRPFCFSPCSSRQVAVTPFLSLSLSLSPSLSLTHSLSLPISLPVSFSTRLGHRIGRMLGALFHQVLKKKGGFFLFLFALLLFFSSGLVCLSFGLAVVIVERRDVFPS